MYERLIAWLFGQFVLVVVCAAGQTGSGTLVFGVGLWPR